MDATLSQILTELFRLTAENSDLRRRLDAIERHLESLTADNNKKEPANEP